MPKPKKKKIQALAVRKPQPPAERLTAESLEESFIETGKKVELFERFIKANLKEGVDYGAATDHADSKPTLLKPGSEKLFLLLNARPEFVRDNETLEHLAPAIREETVALLCRLVSRTDATVLGEGRGTSSVWKLAKGAKILDVNRAVKMAEKRAQMDAVLRVAALSSRFTQDLEDPEYKDVKDHQARQSTIRPSAAPRPAGYEGNTDRGYPSTKAQQNCIVRQWSELMRAYGHTDTVQQEAHRSRWMNEKLGKTIVEDLTKKQASFMIDEIVRMKREFDQKAKAAPINGSVHVGASADVPRAIIDATAAPRPTIKYEAMTDEEMSNCVARMRGMRSVAQLENYINDVRAWPKLPKQQALLNQVYSEVLLSLPQ